MAYSLGPMLASTIEDARTEKHLLEDGYLLVQPKIDGMRVLFYDGLPKSRSWTTWTSRAFQKFASEHSEQIHGWDGEMVAGLPGQAQGFRRDMSEIRAANGGQEFTYYLFDNFDPSWANNTFEYRFTACYQDMLGPAEAHDPESYRRIYPVEALTRSQEGFSRLFEGEGYKIQVVLCPTRAVQSMEEIYALYSECLDRGYEGLILRRKGRGYKYGRSTASEGSLIRIKPFADFEAVVSDMVGSVEPAYHNANELTISALGHAKRSSHQANMIPKDYVGALWCHKLNDDPTNLFKVGIFKGVSIEERKIWLLNKEKLPGKIMKVKSLGIEGGYDKPRVGCFLSWRDPIDMGEPS